MSEHDDNVDGRYERNRLFAVVVVVATYGGFECIGVVVGPTNYVETPERYMISRQVYPGLYVREIH